VAKLSERATKQKQAIEQIFMANQRPLTAAETYSLCQESLPGIGIATIYRAIKRLVEHSFIVPLEIPGIGTCYELAELPPHHIHFVCHDCNKVFELTQYDHVQLPPLPEGFTAQNFDLLVKGSCRDCTHAGEPHHAAKPSHAGEPPQAGEHHG
jgi:Fur family transcriptional regulator, ferric uptake regulator